MDCFCGCGRRVPRSQTEANLRVGEMSLELLAWDRYRTLESPDPPERAEVDRLIDRGVGCRRRLLLAVHDEREGHSLAESDDWLRESRSAWSSRPSMKERGTIIRGPKLRLTEEDIARLDRVDPERSFSGEPSPPADPQPPRPAGPAASDDLVAALERLGRLHRDGLLTDAEFDAAKAKLLG